MEIKGSIDEIRFRNEENGYTIAVLDVEGEPLIAVGTFPPLSEGEYVSLEGEYVLHPKFGKQFKAVKIVSGQPDSADGIIRYLGSGLIKGVGPKTALMLVNAFGARTLEVIESMPLMMSKIKGISRKKAEEISSEYIKIKDMKEAVMYLQSRNISLSLSLKIYKTYGEQTVAAVKSNPYRLIEEIDGVGFLTADKIAAEVGIARDSNFRISAGIIYSLMHSGERNGNTFLPAEMIVTEASALLEIEPEKISERIEELMISGKLRKFSDGESEGYALTATFRAEKAAAAKLIALKEEANRIYVSCGEEISQFETLKNIKLHHHQKDAVESAILNGVSVITGGPGTGKTTIIKCILSILDSHKLTYTLMAPTGRAAKRLSETTGRDASTIHRALMLTPGSNYGGEILSTDAVIVDEFSMVDIFLFNSLLQNLRTGTKLIIVGDKDQLPSVGAGNVLADIMSSGSVPVANLTEVYRQGEESLITLNAHAINRGEMPLLSNGSGDFFFIREKDPARIATLTSDLAAERIPKYINSDPSKIQILSPIKNGLCGTNNLNSVMQQRLNGQAGDEIMTEGFKFKKGDRVMHTANNYSLSWKKLSAFGSYEGEGVFNGDLGYIEDIRPEIGEIDVFFEDGRLATYTPDIRNQLILAYAITIHKSQGSEFDGCIIPVYGGNPMIMTRNLLYTAITRAKKIVVLVGEEYNIKRMVDNNYIAKRYSMLKTFISESAVKFGILYAEQEN